jgi:ubiquinone/menaquinone biosynthesis C-methylase UbiE
MVRITARWYREVLERIPAGSELLDVGIGTGSALTRNAELVKLRKLRITGLDIDSQYLERCRENIARRDLDDYVMVRPESVYAHHGGPYNAVYFSGSFMLLPDQKRALLHVSELLRPGGEILFTQTFQEKKSGLIERIKPQLHRATTVRFGRVTYEEDFRRLLLEADLDLSNLEVLSRDATRSYRLAVAQVRQATADSVDRRLGDAGLGTPGALGGEMRSADR